MDIYNHRSGLHRLKEAAMSADSLRIGYIGGSITQEAPKTNWPEYVSAWLKARYPQKWIYAENVGIGATGSNFASLRFDSEMAQRGCDIIFVEFAVNDSVKSSEFRMRTREGLVRKILAKTDADIVFVYTSMDNMYDDMRDGRLPQSIADFEAIAEHYGIGSVWMGKKAFDMVGQGLLRLEEWLPDALHPQWAGSRIYAQAVIEFLSDELDGTAQGEKIKRDTPALNAFNWENGRLIPFEQIQTQGPWIIKSVYERDLGHVLFTSSFEAKASFHCRCRALAVCMLYGNICAGLRYRLNGGEWQVMKQDILPWMGLCNYLYHDMLIDSDEEADYFVELEPEKIPGSTGLNVSIVHIGIV